MSLFPNTPTGKDAKRQFWIGMALLIYALLMTVWPNLIWVTFVIITLFIPVLIILLLFFGRGVIRTLIWYVRALVKGE